MRSKQVLWIEDDSAQVRPVKERLERRDVDVIFASNLKSAESIITEREKYLSLIIIDNYIPDCRDIYNGESISEKMRGVGFIEEIAKKRLYSGRILVLSFFLPGDEKREELRRIVGDDRITFMDKQEITLRGMVDRITSLISGNDHRSKAMN